jgi:hypothetical protein
LSTSLDAAEASARLRTSTSLAVASFVFANSISLALRGALDHRR